MNRNRHLTFRCTQEEYNLIKAHCGKNLSRFIVSRLFKGMAEDVRPIHVDSAGNIVSPPPFGRIP